jgi:hypothetical protein
VERWLDLGDGELLYVEGNEDIDRIGPVDGTAQLDRRVFEEQIKFRSSQLDSRAVEPQIFHFLCAFAENHRHQRAFHGILRSNATVAARARKPFLRWVAGYKITAEKLQRELERRVPDDAVDALGYVLDNNLLDQFVKSITWATAAPAPESLERQLCERLQAEVASHPANRTLAAMLRSVLAAGTREIVAARCLSALDRDILFNDLALEKLVRDFRAERIADRLALAALERDGQCVAVAVLASGDLHNLAEKALASNRILFGVDAREPQSTLEALLPLSPMFVAYAAAAPAARGALRACLRDVAEQARHRWFAGEHRPTVGVSQSFPDGLRSRLSSRHPAFQIQEDDSAQVHAADALAEVLVKGILGESSALRLVKSVGDRLRRLHMLTDGTYFTAENPWPALRNEG